jgi:hypothetical protein
LLKFRLIVCLIVCMVMSVLAAAFPAQAQYTPVPLPDPSLLNDPVWARPGYAGWSQLFINRTRYLLALSLDNGILNGQAQILYVNNANVTHNGIVLRTYPNHPVHEGRTMRISSLTVNGANVNWTFRDAAQTIVDVPMPTPIPFGGSATIDVTYTINYPRGSFFYMAEPFPIVAVYDSSGWRTEVATNGLDYAYNETALKVVNLRAPTNAGTWFVGAIKSSIDHGDGTTTYTIVTGPVRNFIVLQAYGWGVLDFDGAGVPIRVLYVGSPTGAQEIGSIAVEVFNWYDSTIANYPYAEFDIVAMSFSSGGEEYPGIVFINNARDSVYKRFIVAHEVGHQWFYGIAGNDILQHAWLDESMTQIGGYLFYRTTGYGGANSAETFWNSILTWYNRRTSPKLLNTHLMDYRDFSDYMSNIYGGGAVFLRQLSERMGDAAFLAGLRSYVQTVYLGVGYPEQFYAAMQAQTGVSLAPLFCQNVGIMC